MERIEKFWLALCIALVFFLLVMYVSATAQDVLPEYDITVTTVAIYWFDSEEQLQAYLDDYEISGMSACEWNPIMNISFCDLFLVRPLFPITVDTLENSETGKIVMHEFLHALWGSYHSEDHDER